MGACIAFFSLCCAGKCAYRPGGGPRRKNSGSGVLSRGAQRETECHGRDAAAGISEPHICLACLSLFHLNEPGFALVRAVHFKVLHTLVSLNQVIIFCSIYFKVFVLSNASAALHCRSLVLLLLEPFLNFKRTSERFGLEPLARWVGSPQSSLLPRATVMTDKGFFPHHGS